MSANPVGGVSKCNFKVDYAKQKIFLNNNQKRRRLLWGPPRVSSETGADAKWESVLWSDESAFQIMGTKKNKRRAKYGNGMLNG